MAANQFERQTCDRCGASREVAIERRDGSSYFEATEKLAKIFSQGGEEPMSLHVCEACEEDFVAWARRKPVARPLTTKRRRKTPNRTRA